MTKLTMLMKGKVAAAVLGVILVGGGGGAVAVAATQGRLSGLGIQMASSAQQNSSTGASSASPKDGSHAEGMFTCTLDAQGNPTGEITVTDAQNDQYSFNVTSSTVFNGDIHGNDKGGAASGSTSASNPTFDLSSLCDLAGKVKIQVQGSAAAGSSTTFDADKITVEGPGSGGAVTGEGNGKPESTGTPDTRHDFTGSIVTVTGTSFTMTVNGVQYTVDASNAKFDGGSLVTLQAGANVQVEGTVSGTTITAYSVEVQSSGSGSDH